MLVAEPTFVGGKMIKNVDVLHIKLSTCWKFLYILHRFT